jgi:DNA polymerase-3 subunit beta
MKLSIQKADLQRGLARIQAIVERRNSMPILANVLLDARKDAAGSLLIAATDLEVGIRSSQDADVAKPGALTVSARKLYDVVRELPDEPVALAATSNSYLEIQCGRARFSLAGASAEEYPSLPEFPSDKLVRLPAAVLSVMIERTMYAASVDETRYNLNGAFVEVDANAGKLRMVATDGHRLALVDRALGPEVEGLASGVIIPRKGLAETKRLVDEEDADDVEIGFSGNSGLVRRGGVTLVMRLIEGEFPDYRKVIPSSFDHTLVLSSEVLVHALRRVAVLSSERSRAVKLELTEGRLVASSNNPDLGEAQEELDVDYGGGALTLGFNVRYLLDALGALGAKEVRIGLRDANSPAQVQPTDDGDALAVVMPMRL